MSRDLARGLAEGLHAAGVRTIFGMPGGGPNLDMIGCAQALGIDFVLVHGETSAAIMAGTYGRLTDSPGVAVVTRGPGLTSALNGLAQATLDRYPLLLVSDTVPRRDAVRVGHQRLDQVALARPVSKWSGTMGHADVAALVASVAELAMRAPAGGVHLAFDPSVDGDAPPPQPAAPVADPPTLERALQATSGCERPVVVVGLDAARHPADVRAALGDTSCPVLVTYQAKGVVPESWPCFAGLFTNSAMERPVLEQADVILAIGLDPVEPLPTPWNYAAPVVMLHSHEIDGSYFGRPLVVVGSYREHLPMLMTATAPTWAEGTGRAVRAADIARLDAVTTGLSPNEVVRTVRAEVDGDAVLTVDAGAHMLVAMQLWPTDEADSVLISNGLSTMGFSLPAAIGAALARPSRPVVCFVGDGGLGMTLAELETLARVGANVTVVVFNDGALSLIKLKQGDAQGGVGAVGYGPVDFAMAAESMGLPAERAGNAGELTAALRRLRTGPRLIDARVDPSAYPHVLRVTRG